MTKKEWTPEEDEDLLALVRAKSEWNTIFSRLLNTRSPAAIYSRVAIKIKKEGNR